MDLNKEVDGRYTYLMPRSMQLKSVSQLGDVATLDAGAMLTVFRPCHKHLGGVVADSLGRKDGRRC